MNKKCTYCHDGYIKKGGVYTPCNHCISPERFEKTLTVAINNCGSDMLKKRALVRIKYNLPDYPVVALMEAEDYGKFSKDFVDMLKNAYDIKPFMDVKYKNI